MSGNSSPLRVAVARTLTYSVACPDYEPFKDIYDDRLAEASQWVLFSVLFTALLIRVDVAKEDKDDQEKLGIILVVLTLVPVLYAVALTMYDLNQKFSEGREKFKEIKTKAKPLELELESIYGRSSEAVGRSNEGPNAAMETSVSGSTSSATFPASSSPPTLAPPPPSSGPPLPTAPPDSQFEAVEMEEKQDTPLAEIPAHEEDFRREFILRMRSKGLKCCKVRFASTSRAEP